MNSVGTMIQKLGALVGTKTPTDWETGFITNVVERTKDGLVTTGLSESQVEKIEELHARHFA